MNDSASFFGAQSVRRSRIFEAGWDTECAECDDAVWEGDMILYRNDKLIHEECDGPGDE